MKRQIFLSFFFTVFFRLPIYESIAAIFWQSANYVYFIFSTFEFVCFFGSPCSMICGADTVVLSFSFSSLDCISAFVLLCFFHSLHLLITFFVVHKSRCSCLAPDLPHSLFQLNGFKILCIELGNVVNTVNVKRIKSKTK